MRNLLVLSAILFVFSCSSKSYPDAKWEGKPWTLVEIMGIPVQTSGSIQDAHLEFDSQRREVAGNGGCNRIMAPYEIEKKGQIEFGEIGLTRMACQNAAFENKFLETLKSVRYYSYSGGELLFKNGKKDVILKFQ